MKRAINGDVLSFLNKDGIAVATMTETIGDNSMCSVVLSGKINNENSYDIADELLALVSTGNGLTLDIGSLDYMSYTFADLLVQIEVQMEKTSWESVPILNMPVNIYNTLREQGCISSLDYTLKE